MCVPLKIYIGDILIYQLIGIIFIVAHESKVQLYYFFRSVSFGWTLDCSKQLAASAINSSAENFRLHVQLSMSTALSTDSWK